MAGRQVKHFFKIHSFYLNGSWPKKMEAEEKKSLLKIFKIATTDRNIWTAGRVWFYFFSFLLLWQRAANEKDNTSMAVAPCPIFVMKKEHKYKRWNLR